jgi:hypothetical protein
VNLSRKRNVFESFILTPATHYIGEGGKGVPEKRRIQYCILKHKKDKIGFK